MLAAWLEARGEPAYRAAQIMAGVHRPEVTELRRDLRPARQPAPGPVTDPSDSAPSVGSHVLEADGGLTAKAVHELADGQRVESVLMRYPGRRGSAPRTTICISSQAGCAVACPFCATGQAGFGRQLSPGEIVDQVLHWHRDPWLALGADWRPGAGSGHYNIVFMGMGEPLNNTDRVFDAVRLLNDPERLGIGARHITVSTSGVVPGIDRMIEELPQVNLAISLHAADDTLRDELVPLNRKWPLGGADGRRPPLRGADAAPGEPRVRDDRRRERQPRAGRAPGRAGGWLAQPRQPHPAQPDAGLALERHAAAAGVAPSPACSERAGVPVTVRDTRGREIEAACGQLHAQLAGRDLPITPARRGRESRSWRHEPPPTADQRQHPECRLRPAGRGGASRRRRRRRLDPPGRHGRPLRAQPHHGSGGGRRGAAPLAAAVPQPPDDQPAAAST